MYQQSISKRLIRNSWYFTRNWHHSVGLIGRSAVHSWWMRTAKKRGTEEHVRALLSTDGREPLWKEMYVHVYQTACMCLCVCLNEHEKMTVTKIDCPSFDECMVRWHAEAKRAWYAQVKGCTCGTPMTLVTFHSISIGLVTFYISGQQSDGASCR